MSSAFESLPAEVIQSILTFAADDTKSLHRCELTSKVIGSVVLEDKTWAFLPGVSQWEHDDRVQTNRLKACLSTAIDSIREEQCNETPVLATAFSGKRFRTESHHGLHFLVDAVIRAMAPVANGPAFRLDHDHYSLRGDTLYAFAEIVQDIMTKVIQRGHKISVFVAEATGHYPILTKEQLESDEHLMSNLNGFAFWTQYFRVDVHAIASTILPNEELVRDAVIRSLSRRAGVARMTCEAYKFSWSVLVQVVFVLVRGAALFDLMGKGDNSDTREHPFVKPNQSILRMIPPLPIRSPCDCGCAKGYLNSHTVVPHQIEASASAQFGNIAGYKVYDHGEAWLIPGDFEEGSQEWLQAMEEAIAETESHYTEDRNDLDAVEDAFCNMAVEPFDLYSDEDSTDRDDDDEDEGADDETENDNEEMDTD